MPRLYINSFHPLVDSKEGVAAREQFNLPPFIDGSIRREPDFEHPAPVISCLCRGGRFAPRLEKGDRVVYLTVKAAGPQRLVAVLAVERLHDSHAEAARWFRQRDLALPNNLIVPGNPAKPLTHSHRDFRQPNQPTTDRHAGCRGGGCSTDERGIDPCSDAAIHAAWDREYHARAAEHPRVVGCSVIYCNPHWSAPVVTDDDLEAVFGKVPHTLNPGRQDITLLPRLLERVGIDVLLSSP